jgi:CheY-like chemotaxis protein
MGRSPADATGERRRAIVNHPCIRRSLLAVGRAEGAGQDKSRRLEMTEEIWAQLKGSRILVVEDNALIGMLYADLLTEMGHTVCAIAATQTEAVAAATLYKPDLMIVDAALGPGSGVSAVEEILRAGFVPHVFVSGDAASVQQVKPGAIVLQKPFRDPDLARAIQSALTVALNR